MKPFFGVKPLRLGERKRFWFEGIKKGCVLAEKIGGLYMHGQVKLATFLNPRTDDTNPLNTIS
jgi:transcriptional regulator of aromatic amino acid metabolism